MQQVAPIQHYEQQADDERPGYVDEKRSQREAASVASALVDTKRDQVPRKGTERAAEENEQASK